ncbi:MAG: hypothetical protein WCH43_06820, partial [Verrucomicrobiota bacterium]
WGTAYEIWSVGLRGGPRHDGDTRHSGHLKAPTQQATVATEKMGVCREIDRRAGCDFHGNPMGCFAMNMKEHLDFKSRVKSRLGTGWGMFQDFA